MGVTTRRQRQQQQQGRVAAPALRTRTAASRHPTHEDDATTGHIVVPSANKTTRITTRTKPRKSTAWPLATTSSSNKKAPTRRRRTPQNSAEATTSSLNTTTVDRVTRTLTPNPPTSTRAGTREDPPPPSTNSSSILLFDLAQEDDLIPVRVVARPSQRNKSPYVADVLILSDHHHNHNITDSAGGGERPALVHVPNLDMGGKCRPGSILLVKPARDRQGRAVLPTAVNPKYQTPKCEFIAQLLWVDEQAYVVGELTSEPAPGRAPPRRPAYEIYPPTYVGAHPSLGERIAEAWLRQGLVEGIPPIVHLQKQVNNPFGTDGMRADFVVTHQAPAEEDQEGRDPQRPPPTPHYRVVEIKTVVDTDYWSEAAPPSDLACRTLTTTPHYTRTALFPWGKGRQKGPDGEKVVSARAIHHIHQLTRLVQRQQRDQQQLRLQQDDDDGTIRERVSATLLLVVVRGDAQAFRPNMEACPSFVRALQEARDAGVQVLAKRVSWGQMTAPGQPPRSPGCCWSGPLLPILWPDRT